MTRLLILLSSIFLFYCQSNSKELVESTTPHQLADNTSIKSTEDSTDIIMVALEDIMGKNNPSTDERFVEIPIQYADREQQYLRKETLAAFIEMFDHAKKDGIDLVIKSATRNFSAQKRIWERKWNGSKTLSNGINLGQYNGTDAEKASLILLYSSMPGTSRHHWGTDLDLNAFNNKYFEEGEGQKVYDWLITHADQYGFCQPYTEKGKDRPFGYEEEKWHWSYMPLANQFLEAAKESMSDNLISDFDGYHTAVELDIVKKYIFGINKKCK